MAEKKLPLISFGLLSDVQYADLENHKSFHGQIRHYRNALVCLKEAIDTWNSHNNAPANKSNKIEFVLNLGDIIDGRNKNKSENAVDNVLQIFDEFKAGPIYHLLGNHCLYHLTRDILHPKFTKARNINDTKIDDLIAKNAHHYYSFSPHPSFRFLALDAYDISLLGWPEDHPHYRLATEILAKKNPNVEKNSSAGMPGDEKRFVAYNGAIGEQQMRWMKVELDEALTLNQKVILCSHVPLVPSCDASPSFLWNYKEVLELVDSYPNFVCALAGHEHDGGHVVRKNVHYFIVPAIVECEPGQNAFATVDVFDTHIMINGFGIVQKEKLPFPRSK